MSSAAPLALSVHSFIDKVGSDAGFASIIGLAILVLLYFAQARETSTLRDNAELADERVRQLEAQLAYLRSTQGGQAPVTAAPGQAAAQAAVARVASKQVVNPPTKVTAPTAATAVATPAAPAGVGAPALAAATRLIPVIAPAAVPSAAATAPPAAAAVAGASAAGASPAPAGAGTGAATMDPAPPPATVAAGANGNSTTDHAPPPPPPAFAQPPFNEPPPRVQLRPGGAADTGRRPAPASRRPAAGQEHSRLGRGIAIALVALAVAAVVVVLLIVTSGGGKQNPKHGGTPTTNAPSGNGGSHKGKTAVFAPSSVTVTVLNGTATSGAAARISGVLSGAGYTQGLTTNAENQLHTTSIVGYMPGDKADALHVAKALALPQSTVAPIDQSAQSIACPTTSTTCSANVVVTVGADLANK
jgi:hypothetical protein